MCGSLFRSEIQLTLPVYMSTGPHINEPSLDGAWRRTIRRIVRISLVALSACSVSSRISKAVGPEC